MRRLILQRFAILSFGCISLVIQPFCLFADDVLVLTDSGWGQGIFKKKGDECLIITPKHVVEDAFDISIVLSDRTQSEANIIEQYSDDIAVLSFEENVQNCDSWEYQDGSINEVLDYSVNGVIKLRKQDGGRLIVPVEIYGYDAYRSVQIRVGNTRDAFKQGYSGSILYIKDVPIGMLLSVKDGVGNVIRFDTLDSIVSVFFKVEKSSNTITFDLDEKSEFMRFHFNELAEQFEVNVLQEGKADYVLKFRTETENITTENDILARFHFKLQMIDRKGDIIFSESTSVTGNSFVDQKSAINNGENNVRIEVDRLGVFQRIR